MGKRPQSVISLDLGGKYTGFFSFTAENIANIGAVQSGTVKYDESFVLSQVNRRSKRHGKRNNLRNQLVKRLFLLILQKHYNTQINFLPDEILGLFNKRGYTYASFEIKDEEKEHLESPILKEFLNERLTNYTIKNDDETEEFLNQIASNGTTLSEYRKDFENLYKASTHQPKKQLELLDEIKKELEKDDAKELLNGLKIVKKIIEEFDKQQNQGNLPRAKYFEELNAEIAQNDKIKSFFQTHNLQVSDMQNLIGNLSNYQLKELRRYFNDKAMKDGDIWKPEQLYKVTWRFIQSWHPKNDEDKNRQKENLKNLKEKNIIAFLTTIDPKMTIPPYDDMNNRGAVKCQTLRLNEAYLDRHLPNWRAIAQTLANETQRANLTDATVKSWTEESTLLHRILDTSSKIDNYALRAENPSLLLQKTLGDDAKAFHNFAKEYYELIKNKVRTGIWTPSDAMFKRCDHNPPYKNNQIHNLVAGILGQAISEEKFKKFESELWKGEKINRLTLSSYCKNIEELRKSHGNLFKSYAEELFSKEEKKLTKEEKSEKKLLDENVLNNWTEKIGDFFGIEEKYLVRFANHFSMAQLHTIIDTRRSGFNATCKWCSEENRYRSATNETHFELFDKETGEKIKDGQDFNPDSHIKVFDHANAQRLPADTQRPFSGKIERYIDKLGYEIAKIKAKELANTQDEKIDLKIILEQNAFEYEESIRSAKIKNANAKAKKSLEEASKKYTKSLEDKDNRIKSFSSGICPYCGESLGEDGEIDHILPRSFTLKKFGTVFNSEGNLLYVHQKCNQTKQEKIYKLSDIKAPVTQEWIEEKVATIKGYKTFSILTPEQQKAFKYTLFLDNGNETYQKVTGWLRTDQSSRVNGTQKYLAKKIQEKLKAMLPEKEFDFEFILADSEDVSNLRKRYASQNPLLEKPKNQPPSSHTIDAIMAFLSVYPKVAKSDELPNSQKVLQWVEINNITTKPKGKIDKDKIGNLGGTTIFKDTIYQERFAPIYAYEDKFYTGFVSNGKTPDFSNCEEIKEKDFESIKSYFKKETQKSNGLKIHEIDKQKTLNLFHNISKGLNDELKLAQLLNKFSYNLLKTSVIEAPQILKDDKKLSTKIYGTTVVLPIKNEWINFDKAFNKHLEDNNIEYKEKDGKYNVGEDVFSEFCKTYFNIQNKPIRNKARKVFSLPTVEAPSGGFRIRRKNHKGEDVYQLVGIDGAKSAGFGLKNGKINTAVDVTLSTLAKSKNVSFKDPQKMELQAYIDMSAFRDISESLNIDGVKIFVAPASTNRPLIRCVISIDKFMQIINHQEFNYLELSDLKFTTDESFGVIKEKFDALFKDCNFAPRDKLKIVKANQDGIEIEFSNNNKTIMKHYDNGFDVELND